MQNGALPSYGDTSLTDTSNVAQDRPQTDLQPPCVPLEPIVDPSGFSTERLQAVSQRLQEAMERLKATLHEVAGPSNTYMTILKCALEKRNNNNNRKSALRCRFLQTYRS